MSRFHVPHEELLRRNGGIIIHDLVLDHRAMGAAIEALERRATEREALDENTAKLASGASALAADLRERVAKLAESVRVLTLKVDSLGNRHVVHDERLEPLEDRVKALEARSPPKAEARVPGWYPVKTNEPVCILMRRWTGTAWHDDEDEWAANADGAPYVWIGARIDVPE